MKQDRFLLGILIGIPILWQRYYLPLIPICAVLAVIFISETVKEIDRMYRIWRG